MPNYIFNIHYHDDTSSKQEEFIVRHRTMLEAWLVVKKYVENNTNETDWASYYDIKCHNTGEHHRVKCGL